jgi:hypothetical protein
MEGNAQTLFGQCVLTTRNLCLLRYANRQCHVQHRFTEKTRSLEQEHNHVQISYANCNRHLASAPTSFIP